jgi:hypothetical protein
MPDTAEPLLPNVQAALIAAKRLARSLDDVRAIDYGYAYEDDKSTERPCIRFHMNRKRRLIDLAKDQRLPKTLEGVEVDVLGVGYMPHAGNPRAAQDVMQPGISVGSRKLRTTGTLGALVRDLSTQNVCLLSNWHVLCGGPEAAPNDEISQPGPMDLSTARVVARLERWLRLSEQYDAAVARLTPETASGSEIFGTTIRPTATAAPVLGMRVIKSGAVSGVTHGKIDGIAGSYRLDYTGFGDAPQWMEGFRIVPDPEALDKAISLEGDSGALWVEPTGGRAIGLHFAGEDGESPLNDYALAHPIDQVLARLNVELITS